MTPEQIAAFRAGDHTDCSLISLDMPKAWQRKEKSEEELQSLRDRGLWLSSLQRMGLDEKIAYAKKIIRQALKALPEDKWAISYSGGKDSSILSHLMVECVGLNIPHIMSNTRSEYPQVIRTASRRFAELRARGIVAEYALPELTPKEVWTTKGLPLWGKEAASKYRQWVATGNDNHLRHMSPFLQEQFKKARTAGLRVTDKCCDELKKKPMAALDRRLGIEGHFMGVRAKESQARRLAAIQRGFLYDSGKHNQWLCNPLGPWSDEDVWAYLDRYGMRELFSGGAAGSGCVNCLFGAHLVGEEPNALQMLWVTDRRAWEKACHEWGYHEAARVLDIPLIPTEAQIEVIRQKFRLRATPPPPPPPPPPPSVATETDWFFSPDA